MIILVLGTYTVEEIFTRGWPNFAFLGQSFEKQKTKPYIIELLQYCVGGGHLVHTTTDSTIELDLLTLKLLSYFVDHV